MRRNAVPALEALLALSPALSGHGGVYEVRREPAVEHAGDFLLLEERCNDVSLATRKVRSSVGLVVGWLIDLSVSRLVGLLVGWLIDLFIYVCIG